MLGQGGWQDHPGMAYQAVIVEGDLDAVGVIRRQHLLGAPGQGQFGLSKTIIPEAKGNFLTPSNRRDAHLFGGLGLKRKRADYPVTRKTPGGLVVGSIKHK